METQTTTTKKRTRDEILSRIDVIAELLKEKTTVNMEDVPFKLMFERAALHRERLDLWDSLSFRK